MNVIEMKHIFIGEGKPKICVPIVATCFEQMLTQIQCIRGLSAEIVEIRIDYFKDCLDEYAVKNYLHEIKKNIPDKLILFTFRTKNEGGEREITKEQYRDLLFNAASYGIVDMIDIELFIGDDIVKQVVDYAHKCGVHIVMSNHDFDKTPIKYDIITRLVRMQAMGADIAKIAVMPKSIEDLLTLLSATNEFKSQYANIPLITMSMGKMGMLSRIAGEIFGSCITFGSAIKASAPGQIDAQKLENILEFIHENMK